MNIKEAKEYMEQMDCYYSKVVKKDYDPASNKWVFSAGFLDCHEKIKPLVKALEKSRLYVELIWNETKGTEREGTAMGAADTLSKINEALSHYRKEVLGEDK
jgi:hypothetical protein